MACCELPVYKVSFNLPDINTDTIIGIGGFSINPIAAQDLVQAHPGQFWIEPDVNGVNTLCAVKIDGHPLTCTFTHDSVTSTINGQNFILVGGHPVHKPGGKPQ